MVETDNPIDLTDAPKKFGFIADYEIQPVVDFAEAVRAIEQGVRFRRRLPNSSTGRTPVRSGDGSPLFGGHRSGAGWA